MRNLVVMLLFLQILLVPALSLAETDSGDGPATVGIGESGTGGADRTDLAGATDQPGVPGLTDVTGVPGVTGATAAGTGRTGGSSAGAAADRSPKQSKDVASNGKLELRGEPGDGEIMLTWYVTEQGPGKPASFVILYHGDLDKVEKKQEQVKKSPYRLRGLKNNQHYSVRVAGYSKDGKEVVSSEELSLTPLPPDEISSPIERTFTESLPRKPNGEKITLRQFGYDFFNNSTAASLDNQPVGSDYVVGPGDALRIDLWGSVQARYDVVVDRNGEILIPKVGPIKVWGLNYSQLRAVIDKALYRYYRGYDLNVTLGRLRSIQVFVVGEVREPGSYTISSLATAINALSAAGGPTKNGSLRKVRLLRWGKAVQEIDLYAMFLSGDRSRDLRVENGDTLFVPLIGPVAAVAGEVKRPAIYELKSEKTLPVLLEMAGGITAAADNTRIQVERLEENSARVILDYHPKTRSLENELSMVSIADRDLVKVFPFYDETRGLVTLKGNVAKPGPYQFHQGMRLKDLIPNYDALLPDTYLGAVEITRMQLPDRQREKLSANLGKALAGDARENVELHEQDEVQVFSRWDMQEHPMVSVTGEVLKPGSYQFYPHMTVRDLLTAGGSLKRNALLGSAELTRIDVKSGGAVPTRVNLDLQKVLAGDPAANLTLQPDDMLIVRSITNWVAVPDRFMIVKGEVRYPGMYSIANGERLSSVIARAGGFTERAYLRGARFTRKSVRELQQKRMDEVIARSEQQILKKQSEASAVASSSEDMAATRASLDSLLKNLETLKTKKAEGRIVIRLLPPDQLAKTEYDLEVMGGDKLEVPVTPSVVSVLGEVYNPTTFVYQDHETISGYLKKSGGPLSEAAPGETYVVRVDGTVASREQSSFGLSWDESDKRWHFGSFMSRTLWPGDTIVVPQNYDHIAWLREIKDLTTIVSQVALTAGTIFLYFK